MNPSLHLQKPNKNIAAIVHAVERNARDRVVGPVDRRLVEGVAVHANIGVEGTLSYSKASFIEFSDDEETFVRDAEASLTTCESLITRTGSLLVSSANAGGRRLSIYPPTHMVVAQGSLGASGVVAPVSGAGPVGPVSGSAPVSAPGSTPPAPTSEKKSRLKTRLRTSRMIRVPAPIPPAPRMKRPPPPRRSSTPPGRCCSSAECRAESS